MSHPLDPVDEALTGLRQAGLAAHVWAYLAAEAVRGLNHATLAPGAYRYPGDICSVIGELLALAQRLPQALTQAAAALQVIHDAGHVRDVTHPDHTAATVLEVTAGLTDTADATATLTHQLTLAHNAAARLAHTDPTSDTAGTEGTGAGER
jgi:hypothetical protein